MISQLFAFLGNPADVRSAAAIVLGVLTTVLHPGNSTSVTIVVDAVAGLIVAIDVAFLHKRAAASSPPAASTSTIPSSIPSS
jgi:hypothetical protein